MAIALTVEHGPHAGLPRAEVVRRIKAMISLLQLEKFEVSFVLTNDDRIHELNKVYRGKDRPTDVLAFAMQEGEFARLASDVLGDVIVSVPTARQQAETHDRSVLDEVTMLLAHGLLHLLGWDHETAAKDRRMRAETDRLCQAAGAGASAGKVARAPAKSTRPKATGTRRSGTTTKVASTKKRAAKRAVVSAPKATKAPSKARASAPLTRKRPTRKSGR